MSSQSIKLGKQRCGLKVERSRSPKAAYLADKEGRPQTGRKSIENQKQPSCYQIVNSKGESKRPRYATPSEELPQVSTCRGKLISVGPGALLGRIESRLYWSAFCCCDKTPGTKVTCRGNALFQLTAHGRQTSGCRNCSRGSGGTLFTDLFPISCSTCFLILPSYLPMSNTTPMG